MIAWRHGWWLGNAARQGLLAVCAALALIGLLLVCADIKRFHQIAVVLELPLTIWLPVCLPAIFNNLANVQQSEALSLLPQRSWHLLHAYLLTLLLGAIIGLLFCLAFRSPWPLLIAVLTMGVFAGIFWSRDERHWYGALSAMCLSFATIAASKTLAYIEPSRNQAILIASVLACLLALPLWLRGWQLSRPLRLASRRTVRWPKLEFRLQQTSGLLLAIIMPLFLLLTTWRFWRGELATYMASLGLIAGCNGMLAENCKRLHAGFARRWLLGLSRAALLRETALTLLRTRGVYFVLCLIVIAGIQICKPVLSASDFILVITAGLCSLCASITGQLAGLLRGRHHDATRGILLPSLYFTAPVAALCAGLAAVFRLPSVVVIAVFCALSLVSTCLFILYLRRSWARIEF
ncbi:hypothetical protein [Uliginosibacterium sediminicola]|uniref:Uncharacterized protein n=1 Tax=Uliginosibacterium sediminicola TaxID=2024550 RepID=A0ABU9YYP7_9RHOO